MKEIKTYLRPEKVDAVVHALDDAGFHALTIIPVYAIGSLRDPRNKELSPLALKNSSNVCKLEMICHDEDIDHALRLITELGRSGYPGDGAIFASTIDRAIKIRTGDEGVDAVERATQDS